MGVAGTADTAPEDPKLAGLLRASLDTSVMVGEVLEAGTKPRAADTDLEVVFPVGHFAGPMFTEIDAPEPESYEIRFREGVFSLSAHEYAVWAVAHGDPEQVGVRANTRTAIENAASNAKVPNPGPVFDTLVDDGLLTVTTARPDRLRAFAQRHQIRPLALGLGNSADNVATFRIGLPNAPRVAVGYDVYHLWLFAHQKDNLWEAVQTVGAEAAEANATDGGGISIIEDPDELLAGLVVALPVLLSTSCVYLDRVA